MVGDPDCPATGIDYATISANYGQLTALLAGFAFTALVMILTSRREGNNRSRSDQTDNVVTTSLVAAFFGLAVATLMYSVLAGELVEVSRGRSSTEELVAGLPFGLSAMMLFYCVVALMEDSGLWKSATRLARVIAVVVIPVLGMFYLVNGVNDIQIARLEKTDHAAFCQGIAPALTPSGLNLTYALAIMLTFALLVGMWFSAWKRLAKRIRIVVPILVVVVSVGAAYGVGYLSTAPRDLLLAPQDVDVFLMGAFALFAFCGLILSPEPPDPPLGEQPAGKAGEKQIPDARAVPRS